MSQSTAAAAASFALPTAALLDHWLGHRRVTRRMIAAFPEHELFHYSLGGMRPFAAMVFEMVSMARGGMRGIATGEWPLGSELLHHSGAVIPDTRAGLLQLWDETTQEIDRLWAQTPAKRFEEVDTAFGQWEGVIYGLLFYWIDNEVHHRGQAYVYLRALGIEPPAFYDRG